MLALLCAWPVPVSAQCRMTCSRDETRDPYGCCVAARRRPRRVLSPNRPERLVGEESTVLAQDLLSELYQNARAWVVRARTSDRSSAIDYSRNAAGAALAFLAQAPDDARAGRMRAVLVEALDGSVLPEAAEREAAALGGPRPSPERDDLRALRADTLLNLAWAHMTVASRLDGTPDVVRRQRAVVRYHRAADYFRVFIAQFADSPESPGARSQLAQALYQAGEYLGSAAVLEELARLTPARRVEALGRALEAYESALTVEVQTSRVALRREPPEPSQRPPFASAPPFPDALRRVFEARDRYLEASASELARDHWRAKHIANVILLYHYARWDEARARSLRILSERCDDGPARDAAVLLSRMDGSAPQAPNEDACAMLQRTCSGASPHPECVAVSSR